MKKLITILSFGFIAFSLQSCKICCTRGKIPSGLITTLQAENLQHNFLEKKEQIIDGSKEYNNDVRDFWFSVDRLEDYICYAKNEAKKQGKSVSGFRIYLGAQPLASQVPTGAPVGLNTVFIVPTEHVMPAATLMKLTSTPNSKGNAKGNPKDNTNITTIDPLDFAGGGNPPNIYDDGNP